LSQFREKRLEFQPASNWRCIHSMPGWPGTLEAFMPDYPGSVLTWSGNVFQPLDCSSLHRIEPIRTRRLLGGGKKQSGATSQPFSKLVPRYPDRRYQFALDLTGPAPKNICHIVVGEECCICSTTLNESLLNVG